MDNLSHVCFFFSRKARSIQSAFLGRKHSKWSSRKVWRTNRKLLPDLPFSPSHIQHQNNNNNNNKNALYSFFLSKDGWENRNNNRKKKEKKNHHHHHHRHQIMNRKHSKKEKEVINYRRYIRLKKKAVGHIYVYIYIYQ